MSNPNKIPDDSFGELFRNAVESDKSRDDLRNAVYRQTVGTLRFHRRMKKVLFAASLVGCYLAGAATMGLCPTAQKERPNVSPAQIAVQPAPREPQIKPPKLTREERLRREGDRLLEKGDMKQAVRRYELALNLASADQRAISPERDTWLLMALKSARSQETKHERSIP
jgi:hypothetical protein